jgi:purine-binding chemotaxis protein CheW
MTSSKPQRQIDWEAVWQTLNWDDETRNQVAEATRLRQRAEQYAAPPREAKVDDDALTVLAFELGGECYGVDVMLVRGVRGLTKIARVPGIPDFYRGVVNVRGQILTVLDLHTFFDIPIAGDAAAPEELVIVRANNLEIGLLADSVSGVVTVPREAIVPSDNIRNALGVTAERLVLLNIEQMFEDDRLIVGGKDDA